MVKAVTVAVTSTGSGNQDSGTGAPTNNGSGQPQTQQANNFSTERRANVQAVSFGEGKGAVPKQGDLQVRGPVLAAWVDIGGHRARVNLDSGTTNTILNDRFVTLHNIPRSFYEKPGKTNLAFRGSHGSIVAYCNPGVMVNGEYIGTCTMEISAVDGWDALVGTDFLTKFGCRLHLVQTEATYYSPTRGRLAFPLANTEDVVTTIALVKGPAPSHEIDLDREIITKRVFDPVGIPEYDAMVAKLNEFADDDKQMWTWCMSMGFAGECFVRIKNSLLSSYHRCDTLTTVRT